MARNEFGYSLIHSFTHLFIATTISRCSGYSGKQERCGSYPLGTLSVAETGIECFTRALSNLKYRSLWSGG